MSDEIERMTDEEIIKWQEQLYQHEEEAGGVFAGPPMTEEEKMRRIDEVLSGNFRKKFRASIEARKRELVQELAVTSDPRKKERLQRNLELLSG